MTTHSSRPPKPSHSRLHRLMLLGLPVLILSGLALWYAARFIQPAPPRQITITTGGPSGAYHAYGQAYARILARSRIEARVRTSPGTVENLKRLADEGAGIDVALVQGGVANKQQAKELMSVGRMFFEPLWVFYRGTETITTLSQLSGKRIAIGQQGSGVRALALTLLEANRISENRATLLPIGGRSAIDALMSGQADAIFLVAAADAPLVSSLLGEPSARLMSFARAEAYTRRFAYLAHLVLPRGAVDLVNNVPVEDVHLIAPMAAVVVRKNFHPGLVSLLAEAAGEVHGGHGLFQKSGDFPRADDPVFLISADAERIYKSGPPFLRRYLPFWIVVWLERLAVILIPLLTIVFPLFKFAPAMYAWTVRRRILYYYAELKRLEWRIGSEPAVEARPVHLAELERIDCAVKEISLPLEYSREHYSLRQHIELVRRSLTEGGATAAIPADGETAAVPGEI